MKPLNRKEIDEALNTVRELKKDKSFNNTKVPHHFAMCYSTAMSFFTPLEKVLSETKYEKCDECHTYFSTCISGSIVEIEDYNINTILYYEKEMKELGLDVKLKFNCSQCVVGKKLPPITFKIRINDQTEYRETYPDVCSINSNFKLKNTFNPLWYYSITISFIKSFNKDLPISDMKAHIEEWLLKINKGIAYEGHTYKEIFFAIQTVLGVDMEEK